MAPGGSQSSKKSAIPTGDSEPEESRRSRRFDKSDPQNDAITNFNNGGGVFDRGTTIPTGLGHTPFQFPQNVSRVKNMLAIDMIPTFSQVAPLKIPSSKSDEDDRKLQVGSDYQVTDIPDFVISHEDYCRTRRPKEEILWNPPPTAFNYALAHDYYWKAVYRQFEGRIPLEYALMNLMKNEYSIEKSLENIDRMLEKLPQGLKPLSEGQYAQFKEHVEKEEYNGRKIQETVLRNYHLAEVHILIENYKRHNHFHLDPPTYQCFCDDPLREPLTFEPRWACSNCTKKSSIPHENQCLICQTYHQLTGRPRPAKSVIFTDEERVKMMNWGQMETTQARILTRSEYEALETESTENRQRSHDLTIEEKARVQNANLPKIPKKNWTPEQKMEYGEALVRQLKPHLIPMVIPCAIPRQEQGMIQKVTLSQGEWMKSQVTRWATDWKELVAKMEALPRAMKRKRR